MRWSDITWPPSGTQPAARPVRAPCTVTGTGAPGTDASSRNTCRTSASSAGCEIVSARPCVRDSSRRKPARVSSTGLISAMAVAFLDRRNRPWG